MKQHTHHVNKQFWAFEITRRNADIVILVRMIKFRKPPVNQPKRPILMIDHHVVRFHITMHNAVAVSIVKSFQKLIYIISNVEVLQRGI